MRILVVLYYYHPYVSGMSEYAKRVSEALVKRGHSVTVLTSQYEKSLPRCEFINGVEVIRVSPLFRYGKGPVMPNFFIKARRMFKKFDAVNIHMPLIEAGVFSLPPHAVITYHCDLRLGKTLIDRVVESAYYVLARKALAKAPHIVANSQEYSENSRLLKPHLDKCTYTFPPINESDYRHSNPTSFKEKYGLKNKKVIGFVGRIVYEKGIGYLLDSIPFIKKKYPNSKFILVGDYKKVAGGSIINSLTEKIDRYKEDILFLGKIPHADLLQFYSACDVLVLPSVDPLESFGMVQIEAMYCGTPVVATDLPGVRLPIKLSEMGLIARSSDSEDLADKIVQVVSNRKKFVRSREKLEATFSIKKTVDTYEQLFQSLR